MFADANCPHRNSAVHEVAPAGRSAPAVAPGRRLLVKPAAVRQAAEDRQVRAPLTLALSFSAFEAHVAAQFAPMWWIERSQFRADWHRYAVFMSTPASSSRRGNPRGSSDTGPPIVAARASALS